jgi:hypothetical protein
MWVCAVCGDTFDNTSVAPRVHLPLTLVVMLALAAPGR